MKSDLAKKLYTAAPTEVKGFVLLAQVSSCRSRIAHPRVVRVELVFDVRLRASHEEPARSPVST